MRYLKLFEQFILESGNAVKDAVPFKQDQVQPTVDWIVKNIFPEIGLAGIDDDAAVIGSAGKKLPDATSGDIDIAVSADKIAGFLGASLQTVLFVLDAKLKSLGYSTTLSVGFTQVSFGAPIAGDSKNGIGQVDLMLTSDLEWSRFIYHSPDFRTAESQYKGAYRNMLLMAAMGKSYYEVTQQTDKGETAEYKAYVIQLDNGIVEVRKTLMGAKGLIKTARKLKEFDNFITNTPQKVIDLLFNGDHKPSDVDTYEKLKSLLDSSDYKFPDKVADIMIEFKKKVEKSGLPLPSDLG